MFQYYRHVFVLTVCMLSNFFCPDYFLNLTDLSPSGPVRRFAEPDLGLNCLYDQSQTFSSRNTLLTFCMLILFSAYYFVIITGHHGLLSARQRNASCLISNIVGAYWVQARTVWIQIRLQVLSKIVTKYDQKLPQSQTEDKPMAPRGRATQP